MKFLYYINIYILISLCFTNSEAQKSFFPTKKEVSLGTFLSTSGKNPFGLRSNQYGTVPLVSQTLNLSASFHKEYDSTQNNVNKLQKLGFGYGINPVVIVGKVNKVLLPEAYLKARLGAVEFYAGRRREIVGLVDTTLTSGSYIWSGNALPIPKLQIAIPNYISIIGNGLVSIKGAFAHGWFGSSDSTKKFFLHQKYLYGRIGKPHWKIKFYAGINHQAQWGGYPQNPYIEKETGKLINDYGNDLNTYLNVVTGISLNKEGTGNNLNGVPQNEALNRAGNHLGSIDIGAEFSFSKFNILIYRQSIYEDGSLFYLNNITDGLFGISFKSKNNSGFLGLSFEFLNTTSQGGNTSSENTIAELRGRDNYFNNSIYNWTYRNNTIGTAFILPFYTIPPNNFDNYADLIRFYYPSFVLNNRVKGLFTSIHCKFYNVLFNTNIYLTENFGIYGTPVIKNKQLSLCQSLQFKYKKNHIITKISFDSDGVLRKGLGSQLSLSRFF